MTRVLEWSGDGSSRPDSDSEVCHSSQYPRLQKTLPLFTPCHKFRKLTSIYLTRWLIQLQSPEWQGVGQEIGSIKRWSGDVGLPITYHTVKEVRGVEHGKPYMRRTRIIIATARLKTTGQYKVYCPLTACCQTLRGKFFVRHWRKGTIGRQWYGGFTMWYKALSILSYEIMCSCIIEETWQVEKKTRGNSVVTPVKLW